MYLYTHCTGPDDTRPAHTPHRLQLLFFSVTLYNIILSLYIAGGTLRLMRARTSNVCTPRPASDNGPLYSSDLMTEITIYPPI